MGAPYRNQPEALANRRRDALTRRSERAIEEVFGDLDGDLPRRCHGPMDTSRDTSINTGGCELWQAGG